MLQAAKRAGATACAGAPSHNRRPPRPIPMLAQQTWLAHGFTGIPFNAAVPEASRAKLRSWQSKAISTASHLHTQVVPRGPASGRCVAAGVRWVSNSVTRSAATS